MFRVKLHRSFFCFLSLIHIWCRVDCNKFTFQFLCFYIKIQYSVFDSRLIRLINWIILNKQSQIKNAKIDNAISHVQRSQSIFEVAFFAMINVAINCSRIRLLNQMMLLIQKQVDYLHAYNRQNTFKYNNKKNVQKSFKRRKIISNIFKNISNDEIDIKNDNNKENSKKKTCISHQNDVWQLL